MARLTFVLLALCLLSSEAPAAAVPTEFYSHPQQLISIGTRHLNLYCAGKGKPTVLLDTGLGDTMLVWRSVQLQIAEFTRVCAYDRAGYGFSDAPTGPSDANSVVADIHKLIRASHMGAPVLYVGHSIAGIYGLLLEAEYPGDVAGEVLVDPSFVNQLPLMLGGSPSLLSKAIAGSQSALEKQKACLGLAEKGELAHATTETAKNCVKSFTGLPDGNSQEASAEAKDIRTSISELTNFVSTSASHESNDERELEQAKVSFGNKPLTVLTRSKGFKFLGATPSQEAAIQHAWAAGHDKIATLSMRGKNIIVPDTEHYIELDQPAIVVSTVRDVVDDLRPK